MPYISDELPADALHTDAERAVSFQHSIKMFWPAPIADQVLEAINASKSVKIRSSSFTDEGDDWNEILVNDVLLPGSRVQGF